MAKSDYLEILESAWQALGTDATKAQHLFENAVALAEDSSQAYPAQFGLGYAFVKLGQFYEAEALYQKIFEETKDHKALHQIGMVKREAGELEAALEIYKSEAKLISSDDVFARAVNLYEMTYVNHLLGRKAEAWDFFREYEALEIPTLDLIERGCFFRLKGDLLAKVDKEQSHEAYTISRQYFDEAGETSGVSEIDQRIQVLGIADSSLHAP